MIRYVALIFLLAFIQQGFGNSVTIREIRRNLCFKFKAEANDEVVFTYLVTGLNDYSISAKILDANDQIIFKSNKRSREGKLIHTVTDSGKLKLCFDSLDKSGKIITFDMVKTVEITQEGVAMETELDTIRKKLQLLEINLNIAIQYLEFKRNRSNVYTTILTNTQDRLFNYSFIKVTVLIIMTLFRAVVLTKLVTGSKVGRV